jgi:hypothetical protein
MSTPKARILCCGRRVALLSPLAATVSCRKERLASRVLFGPLSRVIFAAPTTLALLLAAPAEALADEPPSPSDVFDRDVIDRCTLANAVTIADECVEFVNAYLPGEPQWYKGPYPRPSCEAYLASQGYCRRCGEIYCRARGQPRLPSDWSDTCRAQDRHVSGPITFDDRSRRQRPAACPSFATRSFKGYEVAGSALVVCFGAAAVVATVSLVRRRRRLRKAPTSSMEPEATK